jgi:hypothetical protein
MSDPGIDKKAVVRGVELRVDKAIEGLQTAVPAGVTSLPIRGVMVSIADLVLRGQSADKPYKDMRGHRAGIAALMQTRPKDKETALEFLSDLQAGLVAVLGGDSQTLVQFGFSPRKKRTKLSPEKNVIRAAKARLTREKRHTLGSRQKEALGSAETPPVTIAPDGTVVAPPATTGVTPGSNTPTKS